MTWTGTLFQSGWAQRWFGWQLKLGHFLAVHTCGGPIPSNLPSSSPSKCPAALSPGRFSSPLGKPHGLLTLLLSEIQVSSVSYWLRGGGGWPVGLHHYCCTTITRVHGCLCWSSGCSGEIARAQFELMLQVFEVKNPHQIWKKWNKNQCKKYRVQGL